MLQIHTDSLQMFLDPAVALSPSFCSVFFSLVNNEAMNYSPLFHSFLRFPACWPGKFGVKAGSIPLRNANGGREKHRDTSVSLVGFGGCSRISLLSLLPLSLKLFMLCKAWDRVNPRAENE